MNLQQMHKIMVFCVWAQSKSVLVTSDLLGVHRSSITRTIQSLENELNMKLVDGVGRLGMRLTPNGKALYQRYAKSIEVVKCLQQDAVDSFSSGSRKILNVMLPITPTIGYIQRNSQVISNYGINFMSFNYAEVLLSPILLMEKLIQAHIVALPLEVASPYLNEHFSLIEKIEVYYQLYVDKHYLKTHNITVENYQEHIFCLAAYHHKALDIVMKVSPMYIVENEHLLNMIHHKVGGVIVSGNYAIQERLERGELVEILPEISHHQSHGLFVRSDLNPELSELSNQFISDFSSSLQSN